MNGLQRTMYRLGTRLNNAVYRASNGRMMNTAAGGSPVMLLTVAGRTSGKLFTVPVVHIPHEDGWYVVGSAGGDPVEPQWFRNLRATDEATVLLGTDRSTVGVRVLDGAERDAAFAEVVAFAPSFQGYEKKSQGRAMPVALLTPR